MDLLLQELNRRGVLQPGAAAWAQRHRAEHGGQLDVALLELDLIDEGSLLEALQELHGLPAATPTDLGRMAPTVTENLGLDFKDLVTLCPVWRSGRRLTLFVAIPLADSVTEALAAMGLEARQLVAPSHYLALARHAVFGVPLDRRSKRLDERLAGRREHAPLSRTLERIEQAASPRDAAAALLDHAAGVLAFACVLVTSDDALRLADARGGEHPSGTVLPAPSAAGTFGAALRFGGYFVGPVKGSEADRLFYRALGRPLPQWAFVAPVLSAEARSVSVYADNGPRGLPSRWAAELTLAASRLGQRMARGASPQAAVADQTAEGLAVAPAQAAAPSPSVPSSPPEPAPSPAPTAEDAPADESEPPLAISTPHPPLADDTAAGPSTTELAVLQRLRDAAAGAGLRIDELVEQLLRQRREQIAARSAAPMADEVRGLFDKLATDIPAQLARGMEAAFRDLAPRLRDTPSPPQPTPQPTPSPAAAAAEVELVQKEPSEREVPTYRARRRKLKLVKL